METESDLHSPHQLELEFPLCRPAMATAQTRRPLAPNPSAELETIPHGTRTTRVVCGGTMRRLTFTRAWHRSPLRWARKKGSGLSVPVLWLLVEGRVSVSVLVRELMWRFSWFRGRSSRWYDREMFGIYDLVRDTPIVGAVRMNKWILPSCIRHWLPCSGLPPLECGLGWSTYCVHLVAPEKATQPRRRRL